MGKKKAAKKVKKATVGKRPEIQDIDLNGTHYLGQVAPDGKLTNVMEYTGILDANILSYYVEKEATGELKDINVLGSNVTLTVTDLSEALLLKLGYYRASMDMAYSTAIPSLISREYRNIIKK